MKQYFLINMQLPSLNTYTSAQRANKYQGAKFKGEVEEAIGWAIKQGLAKGTLSPVTEPCEIFIEFYEATKRRDVDNIQSAQKFILDAMVKCGILKDDGRKYVKQIYHHIYDGGRDYVVVNILPVGSVEFVFN